MHKKIEPVLQFYKRKVRAFQAHEAAASATQRTTKGGLRLPVGGMSVHNAAELETRRQGLWLLEEALGLTQEDVRAISEEVKSTLRPPALCQRTA